MYVIIPTKPLHTNSISARTKKKENQMLQLICLYKNKKTKAKFKTYLHGYNYLPAQINVQLTLSNLYVIQ